MKAFDANDWIYQTWAYERHDVGTTPGFNGDTAKALASIKAKTLILTGTKDLLNPEFEPTTTGKNIPGVKMMTISPGTVTGHASAGGAGPGGRRVSQPRGRRVSRWRDRGREEAELGRYRLAVIAGQKREARLRAMMIRQSIFLRRWMDTRVKPAYDMLYASRHRCSNINRHAPRKRGIQYAAASRSHRNFSGILDRPVKPGDDLGGAVLKDRRDRLPASAPRPYGKDAMEPDRRPAIDVCNAIRSHRRSHSKRTAVMKTLATLLAVASLALAATSADAKGCLKGAVVGGVAGHYAGHHGVLGAVAGCLYGRHHAKQQELQRQQQQQQGKGPDVGQTGM